MSSTSDPAANNKYLNPAHSSFAGGDRIQFDSSCSQNVLVEESDTGNRSFRKEERWECEKTLLGSNFMAIFPGFVRRVWEFQAELGIILEDTLQCSGRITYDQRQYKNDHSKGCSRNLMYARTTSPSSRALCEPRGTQIHVPGAEAGYVQDLCNGSREFATSLLGQT